MYGGFRAREASRDLAHGAELTTKSLLGFVFVQFSLLFELRLFHLRAWQCARSGSSPEVEVRQKW